MRTPVSSEIPRPGRGRPRAQRAHEVEQRILEAAGELFLAQGYPRTTYEQLVEKANVSKTTLYTRFPVKSELFGTFVRRSVANFRARVAIEFAVGTPEECLIDLAVQLADATLTGPSMALMRVTAAEAESFPELAREGFRIGFNESVKSITSCLVGLALFSNTESARPWAERFVETALHPLYMHALFGEELGGLRARARHDIPQVAAILMAELAKDNVDTSHKN